MQHVPTTVEEQIIAKLILEQCSWENLPKRIQVLVSSKDEWYNKVKDHCIKKRLPWNDCFARKTCKESEYYEDMMRYLRKSLALFPYHLSEYVCRIMRISPFKYYCDMLYEVMRNEQPYDHIPNFSAADALRLTGIGRNEFIDIMNKCRSKKIMWKINKSIVKEMLPTQPSDFPIESWWGVCLVNFTLEEFRGLTEEETATIDKMCKEEANSFVLFDPSIIRGLYRRGLVYFDVPVFADDRLKVSKLEGFVSNREQSYEDPTEELLYALFVVSSEHATVAQLATTLQADLHHLQAAASVACRLGWAVKVIDPASILQDTSVPGSPSSLVNEDEDGILSNTFPDISNERNSELQADTFMGDNGKVVPSVTRAAFIVDANITSYLMMGSLSPGLKSHAVTLYEAGKLEDASVAELCQNLLTLEGTKYEGELQEFANHAFSLRYALECLRSGGFEKNPSVGDTSSGNENREETNLKDMQYEELTKSKIPDMASNEHGVSETMSSDHGDMINVDLASENDENSHIAFDQKNCVKQRRKYRLDLLRCESLAGLAPTTLNRLFQRDYSIIVSMIPLPSSVLPGSDSLVNFGPPAYAAMTPWMKLMLYVAAGAGPLSVSLMKGQRLRVLPPPLEGCEKALLWAWDGSAVGGLGNKFEGSLVDGGILLHCLNSLLRYSAVLVQPLARTELSESGKPVTKDIPLPLHNLNGSYTVLGKDIGISSEELSQVNSTLVTLEKELHLWNVGYIRLIRLHKADPNECSAFRWVPLGVEFGIPLFSPPLCRMICDRVTRSEILQAKSFEEHHEAMLTLRRRLFDFCTKYQATGPVSKSIYDGDYFEMRKPETDFNDVVKIEIDQGLSKVCQNQHSKVLSFEGSLSRTYAFPPEYHPDTKLAEDVTTTIDAMSKGKTDKSNDSERNEITLPGLNLLFDGYLLRPFDISSCLQGRLPIGLIAEAAKSSALLQTRGS